MKKKGEQVGESKYARKVKKRRQAARKMGLDPNTPYPIIWYEQKQAIRRRQAGDDQ